MAAKKRRMIYLPGLERWVTVSTYCAIVKHAKAHPTARYDHSLCDWPSCTGDKILREFRDGVQDRINQAVPYAQRGVR